MSEPKLFDATFQDSLAADVHRGKTQYYLAALFFCVGLFVLARQPLGTIRTVDCDPVYTVGYSNPPWALAKAFGTASASLTPEPQTSIASISSTSTGSLTNSARFLPDWVTAAKGGSMLTAPSGPRDVVVSSITTAKQTSTTAKRNGSTTNLDDGEIWIVYYDQWPGKPIILMSIHMGKIAY